MVRLRAGLPAVPSRVWTAVLGLAVIASLSLAALLGAGLKVWRGGVGGPSTSAAPPASLSHVPHSGVVTVPSARPRRPAPPVRPLAPSTGHAAAPTGAATPPAARPAPATPGGPQPAPPPASAVPAPGPRVVEVGGLLDELSGPRRGQAVDALSSLVLQPALSWSIDGTVEGQGPQALIALVRRHAPHNLAGRLAARLRKLARDAAAGTDSADRPDRHARRHGRHPRAGGGEAPGRTHPR